MNKVGYLIARNVSFELADTLGGIPKQVFNITKYINEQTEFVPIFATSLDGLLPKSIEAQGIPVFIIPELAGNIYSAAKKLGGIIKAHNVRIIQSHGFRESLCLRLLKYRYPDLVHIFRVHTHIDCSHIPFRKKLSYHFLDLCTQRWVDQFLCIGNYVADELIAKSHINKNKIKVIPNGCQDMGVPDSLPIDKFPLQQKIAFISNIIPYKGHDVIVKALCILKKRGIVPSVRLIGGFGIGPVEIAYKNQIIKESKELGVFEQLDFFGTASNIQEATNGWPVLILPSDSEGVPNCILEAMALRKLIVASAVGSVPEMVKNGEHALLHPPKNPESLADILEKVFSKPALYWNQIRENSYQRFLNNYKIETMLNNIAETARGLIQNKNDMV